MKILKITLIILVLILTTFNCSSGDDNSNGTDQVSEDNLSKILGTWFFIASTTNEVADDLEQCDQFNNLTFTTSQVSIQEVFGEDCSESQSTSEEYSINGSKLIVGGFVVEIVQLDNEILVVTYTEDGDVIIEIYAKQ